MPDLRLFILLCQVYVYLFHSARIKPDFQLFIRLCQIFINYARHYASMASLLPSVARLALVNYARIMPDFHQLC